MPDILSTIPQLPAFHMRTPADAEQIDQAEKELGLHFSEEYRGYLATFGAASVWGHEFTGICSTIRLDVVSVTLSERDRNQHVPSDYYVLEQLNIDDVVVWQSSDGVVYRTVGDSAPVKLCDSFYEYLT